MYLYRYLAFVIVACLCSSVGTQALGFELRCEEDVSIEADQTIDEDLIAVARRIEIKGKIHGDLIAAAKEFHSQGVIEDDVTVVAQEIRLEGELGDGLRAVAQRISADAHVKGDITVFAEEVKLRENTLVKGDVVIGGARIEVGGKILKDLKVYGDEIKLRGQIAGDVTLRAEKIVLYPGTVIGGNLTYTSKNQIEMRGDAEVLGETAWHKPALKAKKGLVAPQNYWSRLLFKSLLMLPLLLIGLIIIGVSPTQVSLILDSMHKCPGKSLGFGFIVLVCIPVGVAIVFVTIVGIPLALITLFAYFAGLYISKLFAGMAIAMKMPGIKGKSGRGNLALGMLIGAAIVVLLSTIPRIGGLLGFVLIIFGLGGLVMSRWKTIILAREKRII